MWCQVLDSTRVLELKMWAMINEERLNPRNFAETEGGAGRLEFDQLLAEVARNHSADMLRRRFFAHRNPDGLRPVDRIGRRRIKWSLVAENIGWGNVGAEALHRGFMNEPPFEANHRANILCPSFQMVGVGIVRAGRFLLVTQDFVAA